MSETRVSRRALFGLAPKTHERANSPGEKPAGFSLQAFYGRRGASSSDVLPAFALRAELPDVPTSDVGVTRTDGPTPPWASPPAAKIDGVVRVRGYACLAFRGTPCTVCKERCPEEAAIVFHHGRPEVNPALCTGCGACVGACPAPVNGFDIVPRAR